MSNNGPRILLAGRLGKVVDDLRRDESLSDFIIEHISDLRHAVSMLPQIGDAYRLVFLSSDSESSDQLLADMSIFCQCRRCFIMVSLSTNCREDSSRLLENKSILSRVSKPLCAQTLSRFFRILGLGGPWVRQFGEE